MPVPTPTARALRLYSLAALALAAVPLVPRTAAGQECEEARVVAVIEAFHDALAAEDSTTALAQLADDVTILESGGVEDKTHYRSGHLSGDMRFARAVPR
ncbi:MAG: hypothetical protein ACYTDX_09825, partial [Planctomycetota bacterium]